MESKIITIELFKQLQPEHTNHDFTGVSHFIILKMSIVGNTDGPKIIDDDDLHNKYIEAHTKSVGTGTKSNVSTYFGYAATAVSVGNTIIKFGTSIAGGIFALGGYMASNYVCQKITPIAKQQLAQIPINRRTFLTHDSIQFAKTKLMVLKDYCDVNYLQIFLDKLKTSYQSSYITSSDSSRNLDTKLKCIGANSNENMNLLLEYIDELSPHDNTIYKNNGKKLFNKIICLAYDIKFTLGRVKKNKISTSATQQPYSSELTYC